jgi:hypothetical protein
LAVELLRWAKTWLGLLGKPLWVVADGARASAHFYDDLVNFAALRPLV